MTTQYKDNPFYRSDFNEGWQLSYWRDELKKMKKNWGNLEWCGKQAETLLEHLDDFSVESYYIKDSVAEWLKEIYKEAYGKDYEEEE